MALDPKSFTGCPLVVVNTSEGGSGSESKNEWEAGNKEVSHRQWILMDLRGLSKVPQTSCMIRFSSLCRTCSPTHNSKPFAIINTQELSGNSSFLPPCASWIRANLISAFHHLPTIQPTYLLTSIIVCDCLRLSLILKPFSARWWLVVVWSGCTLLCSALRFSDRIWIKVKFIVFISHDSLQSSLCKMMMMMML